LVIYQGETITIPMIQAARRQLIWQVVMRSLNACATTGEVAAKFAGLVGSEPLLSHKHELKKA
jgi:hypothetical protein